MENTNLKKLNLLVDERGFQQIADLLEGGRNQTNIYSFSYSETEMKANVIKETNFLCYCDYARRSVEGTLVYLIQNKKEKFSYLDNPNIKFLDKYDKPNLNAAYRRCNLRLLIDNTKFNNLCVKENFNSLYINYRDISILNQVFKLNIISKVFEDDTFKVYCCSLKNFASKEELNTSIKNLFRIIPEERIETDGKSIVVSNRAKFAKDILEKACFYSDTNLDVCLDKTVAKEVHAEFVKDCITEKKDVSSVLFVFYYNYFIKNRLECGVITEAKTRVVNGEEVWVIGVDSDQYDDGIYEGSKSVVLTSAIKKIDEATYQIIKNEINGEFPGGQVLRFDTKNDAVGIPSENPNLSEDTITKVNEVINAIKSDEIEVKTEL